MFFKSCVKYNSCIISGTDVYMLHISPCRQVHVNSSVVDPSTNTVHGTLYRYLDPDSEISPNWIRFQAHLQYKFFKGANKFLYNYNTSNLFLENHIKKAAGLPK